MHIFCCYYYIVLYHYYIVPTVKFLNISFRHLFFIFSVQLHILLLIISFRYLHIITLIQTSTPVSWLISLTAASIWDGTPRTMTIFILGKGDGSESNCTSAPDFSLISWSGRDFSENHEKCVASGDLSRRYWHPSAPFYRHLYSVFKNIKY